MQRDNAARLLWVVVIGHFIITLIHGAAHAGAQVPMSAAANAFIILIIEVGPLAGLALSRSRPVPGGWMVAASMAGALVFGVANHFVIDAADHVSHIAADWRGLFTTTALLLAVTETGGAATGILYALRMRRAA
jgi:hypothetical protein